MDDWSDFWGEPGLLKPSQKVLTKQEVLTGDLALVVLLAFFILLGFITVAIF